MQPIVHPLPKTILGRTGLEVSRLGYGTAFRRPITEEHAGQLLNQAIGSGINFVDTAGDYLGSEAAIGRSLSTRYDEFHLSTKCGCTESRESYHVNGSNHEWTTENLYRGIETSLERLRRDTLEIVQLHNPTVEECERGRLVDVMNDMRSQGLIRWMGISTTLPHLPVFLGWGVFDIFQVPYSAVDRDHEDWIAKVAQSGAGVVVRNGITPEVSNRWEVFKRAQLDDLMEDGENVSSFMLRFTLAHPFAHTVIVGTANTKHLRENVEAVTRGPLSESVYYEARQRLDEAGERSVDA